MAQNTRRRLSYILESTFNTTPATPTLQAFEHSTFDFNPQAAEVLDNSVRDDRQVAFVRQGNLSGAGTLGVKLAPVAYDDFIQAAFLGTWTTNVVNNGTTQRSFTVEEGYLDRNAFIVYRGVTVGGMTLGVTQNDLVDVSFPMTFASSTQESGTSVATSTTAVTARPKFFHEGGVIQVAGSPVANITSIEWTLDNGVTSNYALGATTMRSVTANKVNATGTITAYFETGALYNRFFTANSSSTGFSLSHQLTAGANSYTFLLPNCVVSTGVQVDRAEEGPVMIQLPFRAVRDNTTGVTIRCTRV